MLEIEAEPMKCYRLPDRQSTKKTGEIKHFICCFPPEGAILGNQKAAILLLRGMDWIVVCAICLFRGT